MSLAARGRRASRSREPNEKGDQVKVLKCIWGGVARAHQESGKDEVTEVVFAMPSRGSCKELKQYSLGTLPCTCSRRIM